VLLLRFPTEPDEAAKQLQTARRKGFTDVWLRVPLKSDRNQRAQLAAAVKAGSQLGLRVGALVDVLRGYEGAPDVNVLGETGDAFAKRKQAKYPDLEEYRDYFPGWNVWDASEIERGLLSLASVPGLAALTLRSTVAPGYVGVLQTNDGVAPGGYLGYTAAARLACLDANGFDPIDAGRYFQALNATAQVGYFTTGTLWTELATFQSKRNRRGMARLYAVLKGTAPDLPVYLGDRASSYSFRESSWYVRWTHPERLPVLPYDGVQRTDREEASAVSPEVLLNHRVRNGKVSDFVNAATPTFDRAKQLWSGVVVDCSSLSASDAERMLGGIADTGD
jgi:hypothetical protein